MIRNGFIRDLGGCWYNLNEITHFVVEDYITGVFVEGMLKNDYHIKIKEFKTRKNAQDALDKILMCGE
jgi:hypothetical protein